MITPFAIGSSLTELDAQGADLQVAFANCADASVKAQWATYYAGYQAWSAKAHTYLSHNLTIVAAPILAASDLATLGDQVASYQNSMNGWTDTARESCGSVVQKTTPGTGVGAGYLSEITKDVLILAAVGAAAYLAYSFLPFPQRPKRR